MHWSVILRVLVIHDSYIDMKSEFWFVKKRQGSCTYSPCYTWKAPIGLLCSNGAQSTLLFCSMHFRWNFYYEKRLMIYTVLCQLFSLVPALKHCRDVMWTWRLTIFFITLGLPGIWHVAATNCKGCTPLDVLSFDKIVDKFQASLVKFDVPFPYGDKQDVFAKVTSVFENHEYIKFILIVQIEPTTSRLRRALRISLTC